MVAHEPNVSSFIQQQNFYKHYLAEGSFAGFDALMLVYCLLSVP